MGRRNDHSVEQLQELILKAAEKIIEQEGYQKLSARKISQEIGYTVGTLYNVFKNLNEIILKVNARTLINLHKKIKLNLTQNHNSMPELAKCYIDFWKSNVQLADMLFNYSMPKGEEFPPWAQLEIDKMFLTVSSALLPTLKNNLPLAQKATSVLWAGMHGICTLCLSGKMSIISLENAYSLADSFVRGYLDGILDL